MMRAVAVVGAGRATATEERIAFAVGRLLAQRGIAVVNGGLGGVMEASAKGATESGGVAIGLLPALDPALGSEHLTVALPTGMGELRNGLVVRAGEAVVAIGGEMGTLAEIALALKAGKRVVGIGVAYEVPGLEQADTAEDAVRLLLGG